MKLGQNVCLDKILDESETGSGWVKTRSLDQTLNNPCVRSRILMNIGQNVCLDEFLDEFENGSCRVKN